MGVVLVLRARGRLLRLLMLGLVATLGCERTPVGRGPDTGEVFPDPRIVWRDRQAAGLVAPAVDDSNAYYVTADHRVSGVNKRTGSVRWSTFSTGTAWAGTALLLVGDLVIYPNVWIYAFDRSTGDVRWVFPRGPNGPAGYTSLSTDSVRVFAPSYAGGVYALEAATGQLLWNTLIATDTNPTVVWDPVVNAGLVVASFRRFEGNRLPTGGVVALDARTGAIVWRRELLPLSTGMGAGGYRRVAFYGGMVIVSSADGRMYGLDRATGNDVWVYLKAPGQDMSTVVVAGTTVVVASGDETLTGLDANTGVQLWQVNPHRGSISSLMTVADGVVYLSFNSGQLSALDPVGGQLLWSTAWTDSLQFVSFPAVDATRLYAPALNGFYSLRR